MRKRVQNAFEKKSWASPRLGVPRSGRGSTLANTADLREALPVLFRDLGVKTFVDAPCGDWTWMQAVDLSGVHYIGMDISEEMIAEHQAAYTGDGVEFRHADITHDALPAADLLMCRDCLFHLRYWLRWAFLENFVDSRTPYLLTTSHRGARNRNIAQNGDFTWMDLRAEPFGFPEPLREIEDGPNGAEARFPSYVGLWHRDQIAAVLAAR